jgi:hypothetical protein
VLVLEGVDSKGIFLLIEGDGIELFVEVEEFHLGFCCVFGVLIILLILSNYIVIKILFFSYFFKIEPVNFPPVVGVNEIEVVTLLTYLDTLPLEIRELMPRDCVFLFVIECSITEPVDEEMLSLRL